MKGQTRRVAGRRWNAEKYIRCPKCLREIKVTNEAAIYLAFAPYGSLPHDCKTHVGTEAKKCRQKIAQY